MSNYSPIKENAILLKNINREIIKLNNEMLFIKNELTCIRDILKMDYDKVKVEVIEDPSPMKIDTPSQTQIATHKGWFW